MAQRSTADEFRVAVGAEVRRIQADDGMGRLERQQRATRLRTWVDHRDGMWCVSGRFDPETGVRLHGRLEAAMSELFADAVPAGCPSDPGDKQDFLRARALVALLDGQVRGAGRPDVTVVVDATAPDGPVVDWGIPVEVPWAVLENLAGDADIHAVVVRNGVVLHAPGQLDLGRTCRVASRAQRRALRSLYATCAIPGCAVKYDNCKLHHPRTYNWVPRCRASWRCLARRAPRAALRWVLRPDRAGPRGCRARPACAGSAAAHGGSASRPAARASAFLSGGTSRRSLR